MSQHTRPWSPGAPKIMGYSLRTKSYRYTRWIDWNTRRAFAEELYDYSLNASVRTQGKCLIERESVVDEFLSAATRDELRKQLDDVLAARVQPAKRKAAPKEPKIPNE